MKRSLVIIFLVVSCSLSIGVSGSELDDHYWIRLKFKDKTEFQEALKDLQTEPAGYRGCRLAKILCGSGGIRARFRATRCRL